MKYLLLSQNIRLGTTASNPSFNVESTDAKLVSDCLNQKSSRCSALVAGTRVSVGIYVSSDIHASPAAVATRTNNLCGIVSSLARCTFEMMIGRKRASIDGTVFSKDIPA